MSKIKLIALDLDGTIVKNNHFAAQKDLTAVKRAIEAGVYVTIATGRAYFSAKKWADKLKINAPVIACNGARIRDEKEIVFSKCLEIEKVREIIKVTKDIKARRYIFGKDRIFCTPEGKTDEFFVKNGYYESEGILIHVCDDYEDMIKTAGSDTNKFLIIADNEYEHRKLLKTAQVIENCEKVVGDTNNLEVTPKGITKAFGLLKLAESLGIDKSETMAIGDAENDMEIIKTAGIGVAMGNAMESVKKAADKVVPTIDENGVAYAIEKFAI